jgi:hypothetical protein
VIGFRFISSFTIVIDLFFPCDGIYASAIGIIYSIIVLMNLTISSKLDSFSLSCYSM